MSKKHIFWEILFVFLSVISWLLAKFEFYENILSFIFGKRICNTGCTDGGVCTQGMYNCFYFVNNYGYYLAGLFLVIAIIIFLFYKFKNQ